MILSKKRISKALIRLRGCAGWSAPVLFANPRRQVFLATRPNYNGYFASLLLYTYTSHNIKPSVTSPCNFNARTRISHNDLRSSQRTSQVMFPFKLFVFAVSFPHFSSSFLLFQYILLLLCADHYITHTATRIFFLLKRFHSFSNHSFLTFHYVQHKKFHTAKFLHQTAHTRRLIRAFAPLNFRHVTEELIYTTSKCKKKKKKKN